MFGISLGTIKWALIGLAALAIVTVVGLGYRHYTSLLEERAALRVEVAQLNNAVELQKKVIAQKDEAIAAWRKKLEAAQEAYKQMEEAQRLAVKELERINDLFAKHDLSKLLQRKPGLLERRINDAIDRARRMFRDATE